MEKAHFSEGQEVEVRSEEEGLKGSWFVAKVIKPAPKMFKKKKKNKALIEFQTLVDEKNFEPLRDYIDVCHLRPLQPQEETCGVFGVDEVVDAYYNGGWWKGVVIEVLGNSKYIVYFSISKGRFEFGAEKLRVHREWVGGKWVSLQEQEQQLMAPRFKKGTPVEISSDDERFLGAWFPATVLEEIFQDAFLVEFKFLPTNDRSIKLIETVDSRHIRPSPPQDSMKRKFYVSDEVDAFVEFGWWRGLITEVRTDDTVIVFIKHQGTLKEFKQCDLRLHMDWINEEWIQGSQEIPVTPHNQGGLRTPSQESMRQGGNSGVNNEMANQSNSFALSTPESPTKMTPQANRVQKENEVGVSPSSVAGHASRICIEVSTKGKVIYRQRAAEKSVTPLRRSSQLQSTSAAGVTIDNHPASQSNKVHLQKSLGLGLEHQKSCMAKCSFSLEEHGTVNDQNHSARGDEENDTIPQLHQIDSAFENASLPFLKSSPWWEMIKSMEAFRSMPQNPHFHPLVQVNKELREGRAIGYMLNFAMLVSKMCKVQCDELRSVLENKQKALSDVEAYGFNVEPLRDRLEELLKFKDNHEQLEEKVKAVEEQIVEEKHKRDKLKVENDEIEVKLRELQESITQLNKRRKLIDNELEIKSSNIAELQMRTTTAKEQVLCTKRDFDRVAAAFW